MIAAMYIRVSTSDQRCDLQRTELQAYATRQGWKLIEYAETESTRKRRPVLERLMADAVARKVTCVVVYKLDRFGRSLPELVANIQALDRAGVRFIAVTQGIDTDQRNPTSRLLLNILASVADFERELIKERVVAGISAAKARGVVFGRSSLIFDRKKLRELVAQGSSIRQAAMALGISASVAHRAMREEAGTSVLATQKNSR